MISLCVSHIGKFAATTLLLAALVFPQTIDFEESLLWCIPAYAALALAVLIGVATAGLDFRRAIFLSATLVFVGYVVVRALISPAPYFARADLYCALAALTLYGLIVSVLNSATLRLVVVVSLLVFAVFHVLVGLVQFGLGGNFMEVPFLKSFAFSGANRASGLYVDPDHLAGLLEVLGIFGLSVTCWSRLPSWAKVLVGYLTLICYLGLALTGSRGGYLSVVASLIIFAGLSATVLRAGGASFFRRYGAIGLIALTAALAGGGFLIHQTSSLGERVANIVALDDTRLDLWRASIEQWKLQPLIGTGSGTYRFYGRQFRAEGMQADPVDVHNDYLHLLCEYGLLGALLFSLFFFTHVRHGWRTFVRLGPQRLAKGNLPFSNRLALNVGALCAIGAYMVHSAVDFNLHIPANALLLAFVFGIVANPGVELRDADARSHSASPIKVAFIAAAIILLIQCVRVFPGEYYADRSRMALEDENPSSAISYANKALKWEQRNPNIFFYLGRAVEALGNDKDRYAERLPFYKEALEAFDKARLLTPLEESYPLDMAFVYDRMGRFAEAEWMHGIARSLDPRSDAVSQLYQSHLDAWQKNGQN